MILKKSSKTVFTNEILWYRMVDGDTIEAMIDLGYKLYHTIKIRLEKVDAPELTSVNPIEREVAKKVSNLVDEMLTLSMASGTLYFDCVEFNKEDPYGRHVGNLYDTYTKRSISKTLLENKMARFYDGKSPRKAWTNEELTKILDACNVFKESGKINSVNNDYEHDWN